MTSDTEAANTYAVLFRTHFWDDYVERQYQRLRAQVGRGDVFILHPTSKVWTARCEA